MSTSRWGSSRRSASAEVWRCTWPRTSPTGCEPAAAGATGGRPPRSCCSLLIPVATMVPALAALALAAATCVALIAYEALRYRGAREWIRGHRGEFTMEEVGRIAAQTGAAIDPNTNER